MGVTRVGHVSLLRRPTRKSAPRYVVPSQSPSKSQSKLDKIKDKGGPQSPGQVKFWYAAKGTSRPGAYTYKNVAESYKINGKGTVKRFKSLADARDWLQMPAPRTFYEQTTRQESVKDMASQKADDFFAIKGGSRSGVYFSMSDALQAKSDGGGTFDAFMSEEQAREWATPTESFVVWAGRKVGIMTKAECIVATQKLNSAEMSGPMSEEEAFDLWGKKQACALVLTSTKASGAKKGKKKKKRFYYAVAIGKVPGVYDDWREAERQVKGVRPNCYAKFLSKREAQAFVDSGGKKTRAPSPTPSKAGSATTHSSTASAATATESQTQVEGEDDVADTQGKQALKIDAPSIQELEAAEADGKVRVFACHVDVGQARIALSFDKAIAGVSNPEVQVVNSEETLLDNLAVAEVTLHKNKSIAKKSLSDRFAAARARAGSKSHVARGTAFAADNHSGGYHSRFLVGRSAVGRAKEMQMIQHHFIDHPKPIKVVQGSDAPYPHELDDDMDLPNAKAIFDLTTTRMKDLSITDFFKAKEKAIPAWPLLDYHAFMRVCRKAQRLCQASCKPSVVANAAALGQLMDICLRVHKNYEQMGVLGPDNRRLKARLFLHLQHACMYRVVYANAIANTVFEDAVDPFVARLPGFEKPKPQTVSSGASGHRNTEKYDDNKPSPVSGCYLCTATDHYCSDPKHHPLVDGRHKPVAAQMKQAILKRIDSSDLTTNLKAAEKAKVRKYWAQHGL